MLTFSVGGWKIGFGSHCQGRLAPITGLLLRGVILNQRLRAAIEAVEGLLYLYDSAQFP